jgi:sterol desaturase/sphingolipid hydroxylase (fatty acid hydroxylase superfamily)
VALPTIFLVLMTLSFLVAERVFPGRALPNSAGWYVRSIGVNLVQLGITLGIGRLWLPVLGETSLFQLSDWNSPLAEGFLAWFVGTFIFYWWHRLRHENGFWRIFHQIHHSASRIEILTSFYKHPVEILVNSVISSIIIFQVLGCSLMGAFWFNCFAATGEYFYHANIKTPGWLRYFVQTPELHSIHHQFDVHSFNYSDIPIWDRIFGTYKDARSFTARCGFPDGAEQRFSEMLLFQDVYDEDAT